MIEKNKPFGDFDVYCDEPNCEFYENYDTGDDWYDLLSAMKTDGWVTTKRNDEWHHTCPDCAGGNK